jgi:hypothetical protein
MPFISWTADFSHYLSREIFARHTRFFCLDGGHAAGVAHTHEGDRHRKGQKAKGFKSAFELKK